MHNMYQYILRMSHIVKSFLHRNINLYKIDCAGSLIYRVVCCEYYSGSIKSSGPLAQQVIKFFAARFLFIYLKDCERFFSPRVVMAVEA